MTTVTYSLNTRDIHFDTGGKNVEVFIDYKGSHKADIAIEVMDIGHLGKHDFLL